MSWVVKDMADDTYWTGGEWVTSQRLAQKYVKKPMVDGQWVETAKAVRLKPRASTVVDEAKARWKARALGESALVRERLDTGEVAAAARRAAARLVGVWGATLTALAEELEVGGGD